MASRCVPLANHRPPRHLLASGMARVLSVLTRTQLFVEHGADVNTKDSRRFSALHYAAASGFYAVAHFLLSRGADPNVRDEAGNTPLYWAAFCGHTELVLLLLQAGAVPHLANWVGESPLLVAVQAGNEQMVSLLLSAGAVNAACLEGGITPLHLAAALGTERIALMLMHAGAFVNMLDEYGTSLSRLAGHNTTHALLTNCECRRDSAGLCRQGGPHLHRATPGERRG